MFTKTELGDKRGAEKVSTTSEAHMANGDDVSAFIGIGVELKGMITYNGTVRIDGQVDGEIHTDGTLLVGPEAVIKAKVTAGTIISRGRITGDIVATGRVGLLAPAVQNGLVRSPRLSIEEGVLFNGNLEMVQAKELDDDQSSRGASVTPIRMSTAVKKDEDA
jgi:cytoskeletal protein CcmA (bactofilin family)